MSFHTITSQWIEYISKYTFFKYTVINNKKTKASFTELINIYGDENSAQFIDSVGDIILVSSTQYRDFSKEFIRIFPKINIEFLVLSLMKLILLKLVV